GPATTDIYTLSLHDALPILQRASRRGGAVGEERHLRGRRHPAGAARGVARRDARAPDGDAVAQHGRDGDRGDAPREPDRRRRAPDRKSTRLNSSHVKISYAV